MAKLIKPWWWLQQEVQQIVVRRLGEGIIAPSVQPTEITHFYAKCDGIRRSAWACGYIAPKGMPAAEVMAPIEAAVGRLRAKYDLCFTGE